MRKNKKHTRLLFRSILSMLCVLIFAAAGAVCFAEEADTYNAPAATVSSEIGTFEVLAEGEALFSDRTHVFSSTVPSWLVGRTYLRTPLSASVSVTAKSAGRVYVITQTKGNDSQISSLTEQGFTKLTTYSNTDFSATLKYGVAVMAKDVNAGDRFSYTKWGILVADFAPDDLATVAVDEQTGTEAVAAEGVRIFTGSTKHAFAATMPQGLIGQSFLKASISNGVNATVKNAGHLYVLTATEGSSSQLSALSAQGFVQIASISPKTVSTTLQEPLALMWKHATKGESITFSKWAILFTKVTNDVSEEETVLNETATVTVGAGVAATARVGEKIFIDRAYTFAETLPSELAGKSYWRGVLSGGGIATAKSAGWIYALTPSSGNDNSQVNSLMEQGFEIIKTYNAKIVSSDLKEALVLLGKQASAGQTVSFEKWAILIADVEIDEISLTAPTLIQNPTDGEYTDGSRLWQGIPGIAKDPVSGRLWATWYSGGTGEGSYNWVVLYTSADDGKTWQGPQLVIDHEYPVRVFDPNLWTDPDGRVWLFWSQSYTHEDGVFGTWAIHTENPESENPTWSAPTRIANGIAMNDPVVLANGDWILPTAIWAISPEVAGYESERNSNAYVSKDKGKSWTYLGSVPSYEGERNADENMIIEQPDGTLRMLIRTKLGIEESYSTDGGKTWSGAANASISPVVSRFYIATLASKNQIMIYNDPPSGTSRTHLTAALSTDGGKTWQHRLVIDSRTSVTYPDAFQDEDGSIYVIYDHTRGVHGEIVMAKITEEDILAGELVSEGSFLSRLINNNISSAQASLTGASVRLGSDLSVQYHLKISDTALLSLGSPSMQFTLNGETVTVKDYQLQNGEYLFTLRGIAPQMIRDSIDATAFVGDTRLCAHWNYSIYQNCMNLLQKDADALKISEEQYRAMTALISDLLIYGAAAQDYTKYDPSVPILDGSEALTPSGGTPLTEDKPTNKESTDERVAFVGATVKFDTDNKLRIKLFIDTSVTSSATLLVNGTEVSVSELEDLGSGFYRYTGEAVKATEFERVYNFSIAINGTEHATLRYSILAYAYDACQSAETSDQMKALALATYRYGKSAVLYAQTQEE